MPDEIIEITFAIDRLPLFGCVRRGELVLQGPRWLDPVFTPFPGRPVHSATWLARGLATRRPHPLRPYHEAVVFVPLGDPAADDWNAGLRRARFEPLPRKLHDEYCSGPIWRAVLGRDANPEFADAWILRREDARAHTHL